VAPITNIDVLRTGVPLVGALNVASAASARTTRVVDRRPARAGFAPFGIVSAHDAFVRDDTDVDVANITACDDREVNAFERGAALERQDGARASMRARTRARIALWSMG
jgi:hypothetical protein